MAGVQTYTFDKNDSNGNVIRQFEVRVRHLNNELYFVADDSEITMDDAEHITEQCDWNVPDEGLSRFITHENGVSWSVKNPKELKTIHVVMKTTSRADFNLLNIDDDLPF